MISLRRMHANIWRGLLSATDQEIRDGLDFYPGAHGLCRLFALAHPPLSPAHIAGIYAALSPMNGWESNVANTLDVLRRGWSSKVNTSKPNHWKALAISYGADPGAVLVGRKVRAFWRAIADPSDATPIPVDRHLICLAMDIKADKNQLSRMTSDRELYARVERAYSELGRREGIGNRLASIAWFVQRRVERDQRPVIQPGSPVCCGRPMWSHGRPAPGQRRWYCGVCRSTHRPEICDRLARTAAGTWEIRRGTEGLRIWPNADHRRCVTLPKAHPYANSAGYQYVARFLIAETLGALPRSDEHTHHLDGNLANDPTDCSNYELMAAAYHGQIHGRATCVARCDETGRFRAIEQPGPDHHWPRRAAVLGNQAATR